MIVAKFVRRDAEYHCDAEELAMLKLEGNKTYEVSNISVGQSYSTVELQALEGCKNSSSYG